MPGSKTLTIVTCPINAADIQEFELRNGSILATNIEAMHPMDKYGIPFMAVDDLFEVSAYVEEVDRDFEHIEKAFLKIDEKYRDVVIYPRAYTGHIYSFYSIFCYLKYADMIVRKLSDEHYEKIRIVSAYRDEEMDENYHDIYRLINGSSRCRDLFFVHLLTSGLNAETITLHGNTDRLPEIKVSYLQEKWFLIRYEGLPSFIRRQIRKRLPSAVWNNNKSSSVLLVQGGHEVNELMRIMRDVKVILPIDRDVASAVTARDSVPKHYLAVEESFSKCCGRFLSAFLRILSHYHEQVIPKIRHYVTAMERQISEQRPSYAFYSAGALTVYEDIYAYLLNRHNIDIYYFQHSGTETYFHYPAFEKYVACNENVKKYLMVSTHLDKKQKEHYRNTVIEVVGHNKAKNVYRDYRRKRRKKKKALFLAPWYPSDHLLGARCNDSDFVSYRKHRELLGMLKRHNISFDIKLFPDKRHARYYRDLLDYCGVRDADLIGSPPAEYLIPKYSLIIAVTVVSTLSTFLMCVDTPVIYYMRRQDYIHPVVYSDFVLRNYVATNEVELEKYIVCFTEGNLKSNYSDDFVDRYVTPLSIQEPSRYFAELIGKQRVPE